MALWISTIPQLTSR